MINHYVRGRIANQKDLRAAAPRPWIDVVEEIVANDHTLCLLGWTVDVVSGELNNARGVPDNVVRDRDIAQPNPRRRAILISRRQHNGVAVLPACQTFSMMLPATVTCSAFFSSKMFFTVHCVPLEAGAPDFSEAAV